MIVESADWKNSLLDKRFAGIIFSKTKFIFEISCNILNLVKRLKFGRRIQISSKNSNLVKKFKFRQKFKFCQKNKFRQKFKLQSWRV